MNPNLASVRPGLFLALLVLLFGIGLGVAFGVHEDGFKNYIAQGIAAHADLHDAKSPDKIWRYAQRAHFHATGIAAFSLGLILVTALSGLRAAWKRPTSVLIGLAGLYPFSWFSMFLLAPSLGRDAAHHALPTELFAYTGTGALLLGLLILMLHLLGIVGSGSETQEGSA